MNNEMQTAITEMVQEICYILGDHLEEEGSARRTWLGAAPRADAHQGQIRRRWGVTARSGSSLVIAEFA